MTPIQKKMRCVGERAIASENVVGHELVYGEIVRKMSIHHESWTAHAEVELYLEEIDGWPAPSSRTCAERGEKAATASAVQCPLCLLVVSPEFAVETTAETTVEIPRHPPCTNNPHQH